MGSNVKAVLRVLGGGLVAPTLALGAVTQTGQPSEAAPAPPPQPDYTFVSAPDFMNNDYGDVSHLEHWNGVDNSISESWDQALLTITEAFASHDPQDVLVAGDLVQGHWGLDLSGVGNFGPTETPQERSAAIRRAADVYYPEWKRYFERAGLDLNRVHTAVGDHELGDNNWGRDSANQLARVRYWNFRLFKDVYARHMVNPHGYRMRPRGQARRTAYAKYLHPKVLLVTVDVFQRTKTNVRARLDAKQVAWLDSVLKRARRRGTPFVIVQGHTPVLTPVRHAYSSNLGYQGGPSSPLWRTLRRHQVDLYLNGEVHDVTMRRHSRITQVSHGAQAGSRSNYLVGKVYGNKLKMTVHRFGGGVDPESPRLWGNDPRKSKRSVITLTPPRKTGGLVLTANRRVVRAWGDLRRYTR